MKRAFKWLAVVVVLFVVLLAGTALALHQWVNTDDFRQRVEREATAALGVPLKLGALSVDVWPLPAVAVDKLRLQSQPAITLERVEARPSWLPLLSGRLEVATLIVRDAVVPQQGVNAVAAAVQKKQAGNKGAPKKAESGAATDLSWMPRRAVFERITWIDTQGARMTVDAQAQLGDDGLLDEARFKILQGRLAGTEGKLERESDHWPLRIDIGGGRIAGKLKLQPGQGTARVLTGQLDTKDVEVAALTAPSKTLSGKLEARTSLRAEFRELGQLADVMNTTTQFTVHNALVHGIDLAKAVQTVGLSRGGETQLDTLAGQLVTQGKAMQLNNLVASSGVLSANGNVAMAPNRSLNGRVTVELASTKGAVGVPLAVGGTMDAPSVTLTRGALVGAAIGTMVAPGVGTGAGASVGDKLGESLKGLFGGGSK
jgi:uncharacterized protein involved in outer membrane biogenesis